MSHKHKLTRRDTLTGMLISGVSLGLIGNSSNSSAQQKLSNKKDTANLTSRN